VGTGYLQKVFCASRLSSPRGYRLVLMQKDKDGACRHAATSIHLRWKKEAQCPANFTFSKEHATCIRSKSETGMELELAGLNRSEAVDGCLDCLILIKVWGVVHRKHFSAGFWREPRH
jgi:hypothetical protein